MRILALVSDAYGGHGGISVFNRSFLSAIAEMDDVEFVKGLPRLIEKHEVLPQKLIQETTAAQGIGAYSRELLRTMSKSKFDLVICGHINLLPFASLAKRRFRCPLALNVHGIDVLEAKHRFGLHYLARRVDALISVSRLTLDRFQEWAPLKKGKSFILPNCIDLDRFKPGPKSEILLKRYDLHNKLVLMTLGRLAGRNREKGFDEVLEVLPELLKPLPDLIYMIAGDGPDRQRLETKAKSLGITDHVIFTGRIGEDEKIDHYRLADLYVMPSMGEGFGIVILEALACGIPVIGSTKDGTREALVDGELGKLVDPGNQQELAQCIMDRLTENYSGMPPQGLESFSSTAFKQRTQQIIGQAVNA